MINPNQEWYNYEISFFGHTIPIFIPLTLVFLLVLVLFLLIKKRRKDTQPKNESKESLVTPPSETKDTTASELRKLEQKQDEIKKEPQYVEKDTLSDIHKEIESLSKNIGDLNKRLSLMYSFSAHLKIISELEDTDKDSLNTIDIRNRINRLIEYAGINTSVLNPRSLSLKGNKIDDDLLKYITKKMDEFDDLYKTVVFKAEQYNLIGCANLLCNRHDDAQSFFEKALTANKNMADAWHNKAVCLLELESRDDALTAFKRAIEHDNKSYYSYLGIGLIHLENNSLEQSLEFFKKATICNPCLPDAWFEAGALLSNMKRYDEAIQHLNNAILIDASDEKAFLYRGIALSAIGRHEEAFDSYEQAIRLKPDLEDAWYGRAVELSYLGLQKEAIDSFDFALSLNNQNYKAWFGKGLSYHYMQKHDSAIKSFEESIRINPNYAKAWFYAGLSYNAINNTEKAKESINKAISIDERYKQKVMSVEGLKALLNENA
ncbi:MAG: tetratricopeptide repeat protein [Thermodesulfovibrionales bacterium]|nr:tetratricopeptide repeat protein [Thermodesulfovibrionales bacterium]